jgi:hypothetical protein
MYFLIEYDREHGKIVSLRDFSDTDAARAGEARLAMEVALVANRLQREVVLLQAADLESLKNTHRRYFAALSELTVGSKG